MELKVWVEGIQRIVCGVTVNTTCQDVVFALAHATGKVGRFTLIERWRNNERLLAPNENPLKLLLKWGEYANDVQFILQRSENKPQQRNESQFCGNINNNSNNVMQSDNKNSPLISTTTTTTAAIVSTDITTTAHNNVTLKKPLGISNSNINNIEQQQQQGSNEKNKDFRRNFGDNIDAKQNENVGIVRGVQQRPNMLEQSQKLTSPQKEKPHVSVTKTQSMNYKQSDVKNSSPVPIFTPRHEKSHSNPIEMTNSNSFKFYATESAIIGGGSGVNFSHNNINNNKNLYQHLGAHTSKSINDINLAEVRNALDRSANNDSDEQVFKNNKNNNTNNNNNNNNNTMSTENLLDSYNVNNRKSFNGSPNNNNNAPTISANGALVPPPYRDPPPPRNSPQTMQQQQQQLILTTTTNTNNNLYSNEDYNNDFDFNMGNNNNSNNKNNHNNYINNNNNNKNNSNDIDKGEGIFSSTQYNDLLQLIKFQKEKITAQQTELTKYDAEIVYLENKERDQSQELEAISREISKVDQTFRQGSEQLQTLQYVEEENELVKQQEKTLKSEIALLRSKLANCETELLQCKNKVRMLMDDIEVEQRAISNKQKHNRQNVERDFLMEMERIQSEIDQAIQNTDTSNKTAENLKKEIVLIENAITEKKRQVEQLVKEMKEVNLQSLTITTSEEIKHLLEAPLNKPAGVGVSGVGGVGGGSSRRIIGSPRQLENAVPTSKNPHGVWV